MSIVLLRPPHLTIEVPRNTDCVLEILVTDPETGDAIDLAGDVLTWVTKASRAAAAPLWTVAGVVGGGTGVATFTFDRTSHLLVSDLVRDVVWLFEITRLHNSDLTQIAVGSLVLTERFGTP